MPGSSYRSAGRTKRVLEPEWVSRLPSTGHYVYTLWGQQPGFDPEDQVVAIYVGVTSDLRARLRAHARKWWWVAVDPELCEFEECFTRAEANEIEKQTIWRFQPEMNRAGRLLVVTPL